MSNRLPPLGTASPTIPLLPNLARETPNHLIWAAKGLFWKKILVILTDCIIDHLFIGSVHSINAKTGQKLFIKWELARQWEKLIFWSPSFSQVALDFSLQLTSCIRTTFSNSAFIKKPLFDYLFFCKEASPLPAKQGTRSPPKRTLFSPLHFQRPPCSCILN